MTHDDTGNPTDLPPTPPLFRTKAQLLADLEPMPDPNPAPRPPFPDWPDDEPALSEADLLDRYLDTHQPLLYERGRFWRAGLPTRPWAPVPDDHIAAELLACFHLHQDQAPPITRHRLASLLALLKLRLGMVVADGHFDNSDGVVPFPGGTYSLSGPTQLDPYHAESFIATTLPYDYDPAARCPNWLTFLQETVPDAIPFLQEFAAYCLTTTTPYELSLWVCGGPASGKSTLLHGFQTLLGPFAAPLSLRDLARRTLDPGALSGKRLLVADEVPSDLALVPALTALIDGAPFFLAGPHGRPIEVRTHAKLLLGWGGLPELGPAYDSLYRRVGVVFCPPRPPDSLPRDYLKEHIGEEGPGLFNWAMRGYRRLLYRGHFEPPATMLDTARRLRLAALSPQQFVDECCRRSLDARTQGGELVAAYEAWCRQQGLPPFKARRLAAHWRDLGFERHLLDGRVWWFGVQLVHADAPPALAPAAASDAIGASPRLAPPPGSPE